MDVLINPQLLGACNLCLKGLVKNTIITCLPTEKSESFVEMLLKCFCINVNEMKLEKVKKLICSTCLEKLQASIAFRDQVEHSLKILEDAVRTPDLTDFVLYDCNVNNETKQNGMQITNSATDATSDECTENGIKVYKNTSNRENVLRSLLANKKDKSTQCSIVEVDDSKMGKDEKSDDEANECIDRVIQQFPNLHDRTQTDIRVYKNTSKHKRRTRSLFRNARHQGPQHTTVAYLRENDNNATGHDEESDCEYSESMNTEVLKEFSSNQDFILLEIGQISPEPKRKEQFEEVEYLDDLDKEVPTEESSLCASSHSAVTDEANSKPGENMEYEFVEYLEDDSLSEKPRMVQSAIQEPPHLALNVKDKCGPDEHTEYEYVEYLEDDSWIERPQLVQSTNSTIQAPDPSTRLEYHNDQNSPKRRKRDELPPESENILKQWLLQHRNNPYPTRKQEMQLCVEARLSRSKVRNWLNNARRPLLMTNSSERHRQYLSHIEKNSENNTSHHFQETRSKINLVIH